MKETKIYKWLDNFWYHYKWIAIAVFLFTIFIIVSTVQMLGREDVDLHIMYAGNEVITVQNAINIEKAFERIDDKDYSGDGKVIASLRDLYILSSEEEKARRDALEQSERDPIADGHRASMMNQNLQTFNQEILGGDTVICLLSPYTYSIVNSSGGFMPIKEVLGYEPDSLYDECGVILSKTDFGRYTDGLYNLPEDTILCIRRVSSMAFMKGQKKTESAHAYHMEKFKAALKWEKPVQNLGK